MARLSWSAIGERFYEVGLDRGVLYVNDDPGVAWPGLIALVESPSGGDPRPYYQDGVKYLNLATAEEFEATISSYANPPEFEVCDGNVSIQNGLIVTQQRRQSFGLSYRTLVGNDIARDAHAYKIHLVYNALAAPATRGNRSLSDSADPATLSWSISTLPPTITGYRRSAHLVIDSRSTDTEVLAEVEDLLYGTEASPPSLPTPDELIAIFTP